MSAAERVQRNDGPKEGRAIITRKGHIPDMPFDDDPQVYAVRESFPNPDRPLFWPGEEGHHRGTLEPGDIVRHHRGSGHLARLVAWNNTWSHVRCGRLAVLEPLLVHPDGAPAVAGDATPYRSVGAWERDLELAQPGDVGGHIAAGRPILASWVQ